MHPFSEGIEFNRPVFSLVIIAQLKGDAGLMVLMRSGERKQTLDLFNL